MADELIRAGWDALVAGRWSQARDAFMAAGDGPEALDGLAVALWWLGDLRTAHRTRQRAYRGFVDGGAPARAATAAMWLAREQVFLYGDGPSCAAWFARARNALDQLGNCPEQGWYLVLHASLHADTSGLLEASQAALHIAADAHDLDLRALARCFAGVARVALVDVATGLSDVDEALLAVTSGEVRDPHVAGEILCALLALCERLGDFDRAQLWCEVAAATHAGRTPSFVSAACRTTYGEVLGVVGAWQRAETELRAAVSTYEAGHAALRFHAVAKLADLWVRQGRTEEAAGLLEPHADHPMLLVPLARLRLARGEVDVARTMLRGARSRLGPAAIDAIPVLVLLAEIDTADAPHHVADLARLAAASNSPVFSGEAALAEARVHLHMGDRERATALLDAAVDALGPYRNSWLTGRMRLMLAEAATDRAAAIAHARAAAAVFGRLGARPDSDRAADLLRRLGPVGRNGRPARGTLTRREEEVLDLLGLGLSNPEIAQRLWISVRTAEHHVSSILGKLGLRNRSEAAAHTAGRDR